MLETKQLKEVSVRLVEELFPTCQLALLGGSVARGEAHPGSDLDIVVLDEQATPHWETLLVEGRPVELFVFTQATVGKVFALDVRRRWPLHLALCMEGISLIDRGKLEGKVKAQAEEVYAGGPRPLTQEEIAELRYDLTWRLDDLNDADSHNERLITGQELLLQAADAYLVFHNHWRGRGGKWTLRMLERVAPSLAQEIVASLAVLCESKSNPNRHQQAHSVVERILAELGGRKFEEQYFAYQF